jgi:hypothetical protein
MPNAPTWTPDVPEVTDGVTKVAASDVNPIINALNENDLYLFSQIQAIQSGEVLIARNVSLSGPMVPGTPVYYDEVNNNFAPALSAVNVNPGDNYGFAADSSVVRGIVLVTYGALAGDIALGGRIRNDVWDIDFTAVIDNATIVPGIYYLGSVTPGQLSKSRSNLSVYLGSMDNDGNFIFNPVVNGSIRDHIHYRFDLLATLVPDQTTEGWAPAGGFLKAPVGAVYGYVVQKNPALAAAFPPVPLDGHYFEFQGTGVHRQAYILNSYGIWWMSATAPNALTVDPNYPTGSGYLRYFRLWIMLLNYGGPVVTSLAPATNPAVVPVQFSDPNGNPAASGALLAFLTSFRVPGVATDETPFAQKTIAGPKMSSGPVVTRLVPGFGITLVPLPIPGGDPAVTYGDPVNGFYGPVQIAAGASADLTGSPTVVQLNNAAEDIYGNVPVIQLPRLQVSGVTLKVVIPPVLPPNQGVRISMDIIGPAAITVPLQISYIRITAGQNIIQTLIPLTPVNPTLIINQIITVLTDEVPVAPGDTVIFQITQANAGLPMDVPVLNFGYAISAVG